MRIANKLANFTMGQADILRKAMGKKKPEEMEKLKEAFHSRSSWQTRYQRKKLQGCLTYGFVC